MCDFFIPDLCVFFFFKVRLRFFFRLVENMGPQSPLKLG